MPAMAAPLHVFEPRYRQLVEDVLASDGLFGSCLITRGPEVGGGDQRSDVGTVVELAQAQELDDGRWVIVAAGRQRFRVEEWLDDAPYPRAIVAPWPDEPDPVDGGYGLAPARAEIDEAFQRCLALASELGYPSQDVRVADTLPEALFQMAAVLPLSPLDAYQVLAAPSVAARLELMRELLADTAELLRLRLAEG
jgi:Lon protease-like protein